jgi:hypothetical protein
MSATTKVEIKPYCKKDLAYLYEMSPRCFRTLLLPFEERVGKKSGRYYSVKQVEIIFNCIGLPPCMLSDEFVPKK